MSVSANGGVPEVIAPATSDELVDSPQLLPNGHGVLFTVKKTSETWDQAQIVVQPLGGGDRKTILTGGAGARYLPTGHMAYALGGVVLAAPFNLDTLTVTGGSVPVVEGVRRATALSTGTAPFTALYAVSNNGSLAYVPGPLTPTELSRTDLGIFDGKGNIQPLKLPPGPYRSPRVSRDGRWVAYDDGDEKTTYVSVYEIGSASAPRRLTFEGNSRAPLWSVDGEWIVFSSDREGDFALYRTRADGTGTPERLTTPDKGSAHAPQAWSADGSQLVFSNEKGGDVLQSRLWILSMPDRKAAPLVTLKDVAAREASISRDGRWLAYGTRTSAGGPASNLVFVEPFPPTGGKYQLPQFGGHPVWSPKGDFLLTNATQVLSQLTPVITTPRFAFGQAVEFSRRGRQEANPVVGRRMVDFLPDGRIIGVMSQTGDQPVAAAEIVVVLNWFEEVRERVPK
jgi:dipeptidyl aminopeptidase/acylaminoacyl peptidase